MFRNYLVAALRNLARNKLYSAINIFGLAIGICAAILMSLVIRNQLSYDKFIPGYERTYVGVTRYTLPGRAPFYQPKIDGGLAALFKLKFPEIEAAARVAPDSVTLRRGQSEATEAINWADPNVFDLLALPVVAGHLKTALERPDGIVLTRSVARKYFGRDDPVGETIQLITNDASLSSGPALAPNTFPGGMHPMTVTAIIEDLPPNGTQLEAGVFASGTAAFSNLTLYASAAPVPGGPTSRVVATYFRLTPRASVQILQASIQTLLRNYYSAQRLQYESIEFVRMDKVHIFPGLNPGIDAQLAMSALVGLLILFIASANFVNLSTARSARRAIEVGIRKVSGAERPALIAQFLGESLIYVAIATILAIALSELMLPYVNITLNSGAVFDYWHDPALVAWVGLGALALSALAGFYPAFVLSAFRPSSVLNGWISHSRGSNVLRQALVTTQFAILIGLTIAAVTVYRQREYATHEALRVNTDEMLIIRSGNNAPCKVSVMSELRALSGVRGAFCASLPDVYGIVRVKLKDGSTATVDITSVEPGLLELYGFKPIAGRFFPLANNGRASQFASQIVVNETAARRFGFTTPTAAIGQTISSSLGPKDTETPKEIIGVVRDFSLGTRAFGQTDAPGEKPISATVYTSDPNFFFHISVRLAGRDIPETLAAIDRAWTATGAKGPIDRIFLNTYIQNLYISVLREAQGFAVFSGIALLLACLGLVGLSVSAAERRTKEVGIRKAMGAKRGDILRLLTWEFAKPVLWANLIAWPVAYYLMNRWLSGFAYHIDLAPWMFFAAGAAALVIALVTVSAQSLITSRAKPIEALRYE